MYSIVTFLLFFLIPAHAEYRAFELVIQDPTNGQEQVVLSNLDPRQYRRYHPVKPEARINYRATWMCRGNTSDYRPICPQPNAKK